MLKKPTILYRNTGKVVNKPMRLLESSSKVCSRKRHSSKVLSLNLDKILYSKWMTFWTIHFEIKNLRKSKTKNKTRTSKALAAIFSLKWKEIDENWLRRNTLSVQVRNNILNFDKRIKLKIFTKHLQLNFQHWYHHQVPHHYQTLPGS